jgi:3-dehydrosphinganine reductase
MAGTPDVRPVGDLTDEIGKGRGPRALLRRHREPRTLIGVFGYGAYTPTKFAVRGLGEALHGEFRSQGIVTSIVYPADTDTPGFHRENLTKPPETARLSAGIAPVSADQVATAIVHGIERDRLHVTAEWQTRILARLADLHGPPVRAAMRWRLRG